jgi:hypothetical protein
MKSTDPPGEDPGTSKEQTEAIARQRALGRRLRAMFDQVTDEPIPDAFLELLNELEQKEKER